MRKRIGIVFAAIMMLACGSVGIAAEQPEVDGDISFNVGDQVFRFLRYDIGNDYKGNLAIILAFDYTNNSEEANMAASDFYVQIFQNGIEKDWCVIDYDSEWKEWDENLTTEIKDGVTLTVCRAFLLDDTQASIDVEVSEFVNYDETQKMTIDISEYSGSVPETEAETEQIKTYESEYIEMSENYVTLESEYDAVEREYSSLKNDYDSLISEQSALESENAGFSSDISEWEQKYETLQSENEELKQAVEDLENEETEAVDSTDWQSMYNDLSVEYETLQSEYDALLKECKDKEKGTKETVDSETESEEKNLKDSQANSSDDEEYADMLIKYGDIFTEELSVFSDQKISQLIEDNASTDELTKEISLNISQVSIAEENLQSYYEQFDSNRTELPMGTPIMTLLSDAQSALRQYSIALQNLQDYFSDPKQEYIDDFVKYTEKATKSLNDFNDLLKSEKSTLKIE